MVLFRLQTESSLVDCGWVGKEWNTKSWSGKGWNGPPLGLSGPCSSRIIPEHIAEYEIQMVLEYLL